jgi:phage terminase Nu1 subunit (DNA packaging protein)
VSIETASIPIQQRLLCNKAELAEAFGVSVAAVDAWLRRGCPYVQRGNRGVSWVFNLLEVAEWRFAGGEKSDDDDPEKMSPKERLDWYRGTRERTALEKERGELIPADQVEQEWLRQIGIAKGRLLALPTRIAPDLLEKHEPRDIERTLKASISEVLEELANG